MNSVTSTLSSRNRSPTRSSTLVARPVMKLSMQTASHPSASSSRQRCDTRKPAPPVTSARGTLLPPATGGPYRPPDPSDGEPLDHVRVGVQRVASADQK